MARWDGGVLKSKPGYGQFEGSRLSAFMENSYEGERIY
jgi:hypothetical protein